MPTHFSLILCLLPFCSIAQTIAGEVRNDKGEVLIGASVYWLGTTQGSVTDGNGNFEIATTTHEKLVASYVGHRADTIMVGDQSFLKFMLSETENLSAIVVKGQRDGVIISDIDPIRTELITQTELGKAACCDLAGCFGTQTTVQAQTTNVITNSKELRILGLSGVYNQVLLDGFPMIQGLSYTYGISGTPGTLVNAIFVSKGANSVLQGFESISGQINVQTKDPDDTDRLLLNVYVNNFMETHFNVNYAYQIGKWRGLTAFHSVQPADEIDQDEDTFLDLPLTTRYALFNKWKYGNEAEWGWNSTIGVRFLNEERIGGQAAFDEVADKGSTESYGQTVNINQPEIWTKTTYRYSDTHSFVASASTFYQDQESFFGTLEYQAQQLSAYANLQYELTYGDHQLKTGFSYRHLDLNEKIDFTENSLQRTFAGDYNRKERIGGVFAENTMRFFGDKLTWLVGIRGDQHNEFGFRVTPRMLLKYNVLARTVVRANVGTGWRTVNLFSENIGLLVSSRDIIFAETLAPERATNYGINITQKFDANNENITGYFSADYYRTDFQNQIFPDYDSNPQQAIIQNFEGTSVSNGFQAELYVRLWQQLELKGGYNFLDVYRIVGEEKQLLPFNARHKILGTFGYQPLNQAFQMDLNVHWFGEQRLPNTSANPTEFQRPDFSEPFTLLNAQFTYHFERFKIYAGCENIFNFRQNQPIISWQDPFSEYFDTSSVWGPTRGRETYLGVTFRLEK